MIRLFASICLVLAAIAASFSASAQAYPDRPVKLMIGYVPGGTSDVIARLTAQELSTLTGQQFIVENRGGASGTIATGMAAKARPDGYTLLQVPNTHATVRALYTTLPYEDKDLLPIALTAMTPYVLVVHPSLPVTNTATLFDYLKKNPGTQFGSAGPGTYQHLAGELLQKMAGVTMAHIPYKGTGSMMPDLLTGRVPMTFENLAVVTQHIKSGALRAIAVTSLRRSSLFPEIPSFSEAGLTGFEAIGWFGLYAPAGTSPAIVKYLNTEVNRFLARPEVIRRLNDLGGEPLGGTPEQLSQYHRSEQEKWIRLIKDRGITMQ